MCSNFENILNLGKVVVEILCFVKAQYVNTFPTMSAPHFCFSNVHFSNWLSATDISFHLLPILHFGGRFYNFIKESKIVSLCRREIYVQSCSLPGINSKAGQRSKNPIDPTINKHLFCETLLILMLTSLFIEKQNYHQILSPPTEKEISLLHFQ